MGESQKHDAKEKKPKRTTVWFSSSETLEKTSQLCGNRKPIRGRLGLGFEWNGFGKVTYISWSEWWLPGYIYICQKSSNFILRVDAFVFHKLYFSKIDFKIRIMSLLLIKEIQFYQWEMKVLRGCLNAQGHRAKKCWNWDWKRHLSLSNAYSVSLYATTACWRICHIKIAIR